MIAGESQFVACDLSISPQCFVGCFHDVWQMGYANSEFKSMSIRAYIYICIYMEWCGGEGEDEGAECESDVCMFVDRYSSFYLTHVGFAEYKGIYMKEEIKC